MGFETILAQTPLFADAPDTTVEGLAALAERRELASGEVLYAEGDTPEALYVVASGRLRVSSAGELVGYVGRLQPVGEMGVVMGEPRTASVIAARHSVILRIPAAGFLEYLSDHPATMLTLSQLMIARLREVGQRRLQSATEQQGTFAIIPASQEMPVMTLAEALVHSLSGWPAARLITAEHVDAALGEGAAQAALDGGRAGARLLEWMSELEGRHRYVVYASQSDRDNWASRCLHCADRVLVLAEAATPPSPIGVLSELRNAALPVPVELVLLRPDGDPAPHTLAWREQTGARAHYYVHPWEERELSALARQVTGRGVGLVLGGGGARGFAHIGLIRALEDLRIPVDLAGGTSMGAFVSALLMCGFDSVEIAQIARETFVRNNYLNDYALPRVSLIRGRRFGVRLAEIFGDQQIEALRRTYFCVSSNLSSGATVVHDRGPLSTWVGTSMAIPGFAPPIAYEEELLCDGALADNLPTEFMQGLERGSIVASNVSSEGAIRIAGEGVGAPDPEALLRRRRRASRASPRIGEILLRSATLTSQATIDRAAARADVYLRMPCQEFGSFDWRRLDELAERGYEHALEQLSPLRETLAR